MNWDTTTYPPLSKGYVEVSADVNRVMCKSPVILVTHGVVKRRMGMRCVKKFGLDLLVENQVSPKADKTKIFSFDVLYLPNNWAKGMVQLGSLQEQRPKH